jgi:acetoin utilization protein AcuC
MTRTGFVGREALGDYDLGADHPLSPLTRELAVGLIRAYGLLDRPDVELIDPQPISDALIEEVHDPAYVAMVKRYADNPMEATSLDAMAWGLAAWGDTPPFAGMHEAARDVCSASVTAALAVWNGQVDQVFCPGGGLHHALKAKANGFCTYNDPAIAIQAMLDAGAERIAYVDVDVHHGDGTQFLFYDDPRVLTCSVHESGRFLFPGTGEIAERGEGEGLGTSINIPLPPYAGSGPYLRAVTEVIVPAVMAFGPQVLVTQNGVDPHHQDPLAHLQVTMDAFPTLWATLRNLARDAAGGRWVALGGGGYNVDVLPRAWALLFADMVGAELADELPSAWHAQAEERTNRALTPRLMQEAPFAIAQAERSQADDEGNAVVDAATAEFGR